MILAANTSSLTRVAAYTPHRELAGHLHRVRARAGGGDDRDSSSPRAGIWSITVCLPAFPSASHHLPSIGGGSWGRTVERGGPSHALRFVPIFSTPFRGQLRRLIHAILAGSRTTAGKWFSLVHRAPHVCQDFAHDWAEHLHSLHSAPARGLVAASDGHRSSKGKIANVRTSSGEIRNV
jgi:hypothetical protein